jgi:adenylate cyclase
MSTLSFFQVVFSFLFSSAGVTVFFLYQNYIQNYARQHSFFEALPKVASDMYQHIETSVSIGSGTISLPLELISAVVLYMIAFLLVMAFFYYAKNYQVFSHRRVLQKMLSCYVSDKIIAELIERPEGMTLGGKSVDLTVYFIDIQNFSELASANHPKEVVQLLNDYFSEMAQVVIENDGTIDKYMGDALMAFWGAPRYFEDHAVKACKAALSHQRVVAKFRKTQKRLGKPEVFAKIGIVSGSVLVGNIGSRGHFNYTVIGERVNQCAALEKLTRVYGVDILVSESVYHKAKHDFLFREIDTVTLKGSKKRYRVFELIEELDKVSDMQREDIELYHQAFDAYSKKQFPQAKKFIYDFLRRNPKDKAGKMLKDKITNYEL